MGRRINKNNNTDYLTSAISIKISTICKNCPLRLYAEDEQVITLGIGNIITDTIIILPPYDFNGKILHKDLLDIIKNIYKDITGKELLEDFYVTRSIKCFKDTEFDLYSSAIKSCITNVYYEISRIKPKKVIVFDKILYDANLYNIFNGKFILKTVISPGVMYYDNQHLKDLFIKQFKEALYET